MKPAALAQCGASSESDDYPLATRELPRSCCASPYEALTG